MKNPIIAFALSASVAAATPNSDRLFIVHEYMYPGVSGISMSYDPLTDTAKIERWPDGLAKPSMEEIDANRDAALADRDERAKRKEVAEAARELAILKLMQQEEPSAVDADEIAEAEAKVDDAKGKRDE